MFTKIKKMKEQLEQLKKENQSLKEDIKEWKSLVELANEKMDKMEDEFMEKSQDEYFKYYEANESNKKYSQIIEKIKSGDLVVLKDQNEKEEMENKIKKFWKVYNELQSIPRWYEDLTGICTDYECDRIYDTYRDYGKEAEEALHLGFKTAFLSDVIDSMLSEKENSQKKFEEKLMNDEMM